jgi:NitT/TauT family transport system substrate-binding protein
MRKKTLIAVVALLIVAIIGLFVIRSERKYPHPKIKIAYIPFTSSFQLFVALEKGYFADEGLEVEAQRCANSNVALNALMSGEVQGSVGNGLTTVLPIEQSSPGSLKIYHLCLETREKYTSNVLVRPDAPFKTIADLKGHSIGTYTGATQRHNLYLLLQKFMDPEHDIKIIQVESALQIQAFDAGQFEALFTIEPQSSIVIDHNVGRVLESNVRVKYILDPFPAAANSFRADYVRKNPETAAKVVRALDRAIMYIREHESEARQLLLKYLPMEPKIASKCGIYEWWRIDEGDITAVQRLADLMTQMGELDSQINVYSLFIKSDDLKGK